MAGQEHIGASADILMRGLAHVGIIALVDEATGYQVVREREELHHILEAYINQELLPWSKTFPDGYYQELFRLRGWEYSPPSVKRPQMVGRPAGYRGLLQNQLTAHLQGFRRGP